ncbi:MAG: class IV adenylate cyclase [Desulfobacterales bacterium]|nr:class IV adenylate cyclase [Desulfobacterales bacterium]
MTKNIEIEVKFYLPDISLIREKIISFGAESSGRHFESNIRFDDQNNSLIKNKSLLRLRKDTKNKLTFKTVIHDTDNQFKELAELEVDVSDFSTMKQILESLGYHKAQSYEKWRETLILGSTSFCIDEMPFGYFLEIEGNKDDILMLSKRLGLNWDKRIIVNYLNMFDMIKNRFGLDFIDLTFNNFESVNIDLSEMADDFLVN